MPVVRRRWPAAAVTLARAATHQGDARALLNAQGARDRGFVTGSAPTYLSVSALGGLTVSRQRNVVRYWLAGRGLPPPYTVHLQEILAAIASTRPDADWRIHWPGGEVRRYRDDLYAMAPLVTHDPDQWFDWSIDRPLAIPHLGIILDWSALQQQGCPLPADIGRLRVRFRRGGERCRPRGHAHTRELKKLFQEAGVPPWQRDRIPLIYARGRLIAVWGYWVCETGWPVPPPG